MKNALFCVAIFAFALIAFGCEKEYMVGGRGPARGFVFYDKGEYTDGWRYLEAAPEDLEGRPSWGCRGTSIQDAQRTEIGYGIHNTKAILESCDATDSAAFLAAAYSNRGKKDWFLPSKEELNLIYENLHLKGIGGFANHAYWTSSEVSSFFAWSQYLITGEQASNEK